MNVQNFLTRCKRHALQTSAVVITGCLLLAAPAQAAEPFTDVPADHWAVSAIEELRTLGFSDGIGDGQFGLGQTITRASVCCFLLQKWKDTAEMRRRLILTIPMPMPGITAP